MRKKLGFKQMGMALLAALYLTGCAGGPAATQTSAPAETTAEEAKETTAVQEEKTNQAEETGQTGETSKAEGESTAATTDRYEEIIDRSKDEGKLTAYFLDLETDPDAEDKAGDSTILISPDGKVMLLDAGHPGAGHLVVQALKDLGIEKIDYLVASHPHIDHIGGIPEVMEAFPVGETYSSYVEYTTKTYENYVAALEKSGAEHHNLKTGDVFQFGEQVQVEVLGPEEEIVYPDGFPDNSTEFLNNHSLTLKFTYGESSALFSGDLYLPQERDYVEQYGEKLHSDLVKANHHGKDTSNSKKWIKATSPQVVVAMNDKAPNMTVCENYKKAGAEYHHTFYNGVVKVRMDDKKNLEVLDQKDSFLNE